MPVKQVILVRTDLNMRKGKIAAQVAHGSMQVFTQRADMDTGLTRLSVALTPEMQEWLWGTHTKIVLGVESEAALLSAFALASHTGLPCALVTDLGLTEFGGVPTHTVVAIGPADADAIDLLTGPNGKIRTKLL